MAIPAGALAFSDAGAAYTASGFGKVGGSVVTVDLGSAYASALWEGVLVMNVTALTTSGGAGPYILTVAGSNDSFSTNTQINGIVATQTGKTKLTFGNLYGGTYYRYLRVYLAVLGTSPSITVEMWANQLTQRRPAFKIAGATLKEMDAYAGDTLADLAAPPLAQNQITATTYTLSPADNGQVLDMANASAITLTLPNTLPPNFNAMILQAGAGQVTPTAASGATIRQASSLTKTRAQWSMVSLYVRTNSNGSSAEYVLGGDMA